MDDISIRKALAMPSLLAAVSIAVAALASLQTGVSGGQAFLPYVSAWSATSLLALLMWVFVEVARLAPSGAARPLHKVALRLKEPARILLLPAFIFPLFLGGYTWAKSSIPFAVGYGWEKFWADADYLWFGMDAWRWSHAIMPAIFAPAWSFFYAAIWGFSLLLSGVAISVFSSRRFAATFFTAMMLSWLIGGIAMAYAISAAGPVFAHLADPDLAARFMPLRAELARILPHDDTILRSQRYLVAAMKGRVAVKGAGISAMPSMHIATVTILVLAAWRSAWIVPAVLFAALTFFGSIYVGYHYAVDAPVAVLVALLCWTAARRIYSVPAGSLVEPEKVEALSLQQPTERAGG